MSNQEPVERMQLSEEEKKFLSLEDFLARRFVSQVDFNTFYLGVFTSAATDTELPHKQGGSYELGVIHYETTTRLKYVDRFLPSDLPIGKSEEK